MSEDYDIGIRIWKRLYLMVKDRTNKYPLSKVADLKRSEEVVAMVFEAIMELEFHGKYYSTSRNFATVLNKVGITTEEYNDSIYRLVGLSLIRKDETRKRTYILSSDTYILTQEEIEKQNIKV